MEKSILRCLELDFKRRMQNKLVAVLFLEGPRCFIGLRFCNGQGHWPHEQWLTVLSRWPSGNLVPPTEAGDTAWSWGSFSGVWDGPGNAAHLVSRGSSPLRSDYNGGPEGLCPPPPPYRYIHNHSLCWVSMETYVTFELRILGFLVVIVLILKEIKTFLWARKNIRGPRLCVLCAQWRGHLRPRLVTSQWSRLR